MQTDDQTRAFIVRMERIADERAAGKPGVINMVERYEFACYEAIRTGDEAAYLFNLHSMRQALNVEMQLHAEMTCRHVRFEARQTVHLGVLRLLYDRSAS